MGLDSAGALRQVLQRLEALRRSGLDRLPLVALACEPPRGPIPAAVNPTEVPIMAKAKPPAPSEPTRPSVPSAKPAGSLFEDAAFDGPPLPPSERLVVLAEEASRVSSCSRCPELAATRTQTVYGVGDANAALMFIGEAPGADEDRTGQPFVGRAGQLLTDMITKGMGMRREDVYIANILKCRPPGNRDPEPQEAANCIGYLETQIATIRPRFLCLLGRVSAQRLLETALPMGKLRGRWHRYKGVPTVVTYHPAALLRNPNWKKDSWDDLKMLMRAMGLKVPEARKPSSGDAPD